MTGYLPSTGFAGGLPNGWYTAGAVSPQAGGAEFTFSDQDYGQLGVQQPTWAYAFDHANCGVSFGVSIPVNSADFFYFSAPGGVSIQILTGVPASPQGPAIPPNIHASFDNGQEGLDLTYGGAASVSITYPNLTPTITVNDSTLVRSEPSTSFGLRGVLHFMADLHVFSNRPPGATATLTNLNVTSWIPPVESGNHMIAEGGNWRDTEWRVAMIEDESFWYASLETL